MPKSLRAGAARIDITPPPGLDLTGFIARTNPSTGVRDPLYARALVLDDDDHQIALVSCDVIGLDAGFVEDARSRITLATDIAGPQVLLVGTHTHGGPATMALQDCGTSDPGYLTDLQVRIAQVAQQAQTRLQPATLAAGRGESATGVHNRRTPGDAIDPAVELMRLDDTGGRPLAVVVNYACHPTTLFWDNRRVTADYPGLVCARVEEATGAITLFLTGAIGDVGPVGRGEESLTTVGEAVAAAALAALPTLAPVADPEIDTAGEVLHLPLLPLPSLGDFVTLYHDYRDAALAAEAEERAADAKIQWALYHWSEQMIDRTKDRLLSPTVDAEVQMLRLGDVAIVGVPGELFVELGLRIKTQGQGRQVLVCGFANDNIGYIPARRAYTIGGYEVAEAYKYYGYPAALAPEAGEQIVAAAIAMTALA
jgi:hypothetical protein